jgi:hypothetical protein
VSAVVKSKPSLTPIIGSKRIAKFHELLRRFIGMISDTCGDQVKKNKTGSRNKQGVINRSF